MLRLADPQWLLLIPVLALAAWRLPRARLWQPLRGACLLLLVLFLARPEVRRLASGIDLWVLVDRSASAAEALEPRLAEIERLLEAGKGADDRIRYVDFASAPVLRERGVVFEPSRQETRLRLAAEFALARRETGRGTRMLVLGDGLSTEDLGGLAPQFKAARVPLDLRLISPAGENDFRIERMEAPQRVRPGESFLIEAQVVGPRDGEVNYQLFSDGAEAGRGSVALRGGRGVIRAAGRSVQPGARKYEMRLLPEKDARPGNDAAHLWVEVSEGPSVLLVTGYTGDPLAGVLAAQGIRVETVEDPSTLHPGMLSGPRAVIFNNVPAHRIPAEFLSAMEFFVNEQGGGLMMGGGRQSFGAGGYFHSPLDALLPVSMELRQEHRKLAVAMAIVMDRSGSMSAGAGAGITKMDLANEGAARAIELLGPADAVTVSAVDSEPHVIVPLSQIGGDAAKMTDQVRRVQSAGGGIFVYTGLEAAWKELEKSPAGQRHVILFADAADAEEPGNYQKLLEKMTAGGATVSVIGLGTPHDPDAAFLQDIAARGQGRIFFNADPAQLPALFAQETVAVARSAFIKEPVPVVDAGGWLEIAAHPISWPSQVDGYNLSYLKPEAAAAIVSGDEYKAPLAAFWQRGAGRAAAVSFPLAGEFSASVLAWPQCGDFEQTLVRWLLPAAPQPGVSLRARTVGGDLQVELLYDQEWTQRMAEQPPRLLMAAGAKGPPFEVTWERIEPGKFAARVALPPGEWLRGVVQCGASRWPFGPVNAPVDPEWDDSPARIQMLREVSKASGGQEIVEFSKIWQAPREPEFLGIGNWLLGMLLVCFLAEVAVTRWRGN